MTAWVTPEVARAFWANAPMDDDLLTQLLASAQESCEAYAPTVPEPVPVRYQQACTLHARETYEAGERDSADVVGFGDSGYAVRVRPLSSTVRQLLRPRNPRGAWGTVGQVTT